MSKRRLIYIFAAGAFIVSGLIMTWKFVLLRSNKPPETYIGEVKDVISEVKEEVIKKEENGNSIINPEEKLPEKIFIKTPFASQAPFSVWDERHEEACEEAAIIILKYYLDKKDLTKEIAEKEIQKMINFEIQNYGDYKDSNVEQIVKLAKDFYGLPAGGKNLKVISDFNKEDVKKELAKGNPVIIPAAGRELGNPYYTQPGPLYHNLVLVGYSGDQIITNDPGTRRGEGYRYDINVLYDAIHDFPGDKNKINEGRKAMIVIEKENMVK